MVCRKDVHAASHGRSRSVTRRHRSPVANQSAFEFGIRTTQWDGMILNRQGLGKEDGAITERIAYHFVRDIVLKANAFVDIHSGTEDGFVWYTIARSPDGVAPEVRPHHHVLAAQRRVRPGQDRHHVLGGQLLPRPALEGEVDLPPGGERGRASDSSGRSRRQYHLRQPS